MPKFKVLGGRWGEGWVPGDIIELDTDASTVRLELGDIVLATPDEVAGSEITPEEHEEMGTDAEAFRRGNLLSEEEKVEIAENAVDVDSDAVVDLQPEAKAETEDAVPPGNEEVVKPKRGRK